jgi:hypothetical protein
MAIIKTLDILLRGKTDQLGKDLKKSQSMLGSWSSSVRGLVAAAIPVVSFAGITAGIRSAIDELDGLRDRSIRLGIDPGELASLERASQLAGVGVNQLSTAQKVLAVQTSKAIAGGKEQSRVFSQLGISSSTLARLSPTQQLITIGKALDGVKDRFEKTRIATELFGRAGLTIIPLIANGAEDLKKSFSDTARLGGVFSQSELNRIDAFNDSFFDLGFASKNLFKTMAVELTPALTKIVKALTDGIAPGTAFAGFFRGITEVTKAAIVPLQVLASTFSAISNFLGTSTGQLVGYIAATAVIIKLTQQFLVVLRATRAVLASILAIKAATAALDKTIVIKAGFAAAVFTGVIASVAALEKEIDGVFEKTKGAANQMGRLSQSAQTVSQIQINQGSAQAGSVAAFETVYAVRMQAPMAQLVQATQEGNGILGDILDKMEGGSGLDGGANYILGDLG